VADAAVVIKAIKEKYSALPEFKIDELDGLTVSTSTWWFNVRASNTEPLLRLNVEADTPANMAAHRDELLALINA
jgi:phosphomannomutase